MAIQIPEYLKINPFDCRWDPDDPHACFDEISCGCYMSPCDYFDIKDDDCVADNGDWCCTLVETC